MKISMKIECPSCDGTGVYQGMGESKGVAVVCYKCQGTGCYLYEYEYTPFTKRKTRSDILRVYLRGMGYRIGLGKINFDKIGEIDMDKEGVSYEEFLSGKMPSHIQKLGCPMLADQGACHKIKGFVKTCETLNGESLWGRSLADCFHQSRKDECWERFEQYGKGAR